MGSGALLWVNSFSSPITELKPTKHQVFKAKKIGDSVVQPWRTPREWSMNLEPTTHRETERLTVRFTKAIMVPGVTGRCRQL